MTNQNKAKTRDGLLAEAAEYFKDADEISTWDAQAFTEGAKWADANPSPEVQGLIEALSVTKRLWLEVAGKGTAQAVDALPVINQALETYRKVTSKE